MATTSIKRLLLIDDDRELAELLTVFLTNEGFSLDCCFDGVSGLAKAYDSGYNLILLDVMMPGLNGFEVLKALGGQHQTPILMLTARGDDDDRIKGLELGADDYLAKPYNHRELLARIHAILRRVDLIKLGQTSTNDEQVNRVILQHATRTVLCHEQPVELTGTEYQILHFLLQHHGQIVSKEQLSTQVLGRKLTAFDRSIDMHVSNIRRKLHQHCQNEKIKTVRGAGYIFLTGNHD